MPRKRRQPSGAGWQAARPVTDSYRSRSIASFFVDFGTLARTMLCANGFRTPVLPLSGGFPTYFLIACVFIMTPTCTNCLVGILLVVILGCTVCLSRVCFGLQRSRFEHIVAATVESVAASTCAVYAVCVGLKSAWTTGQVGTIDSVREKAANSRCNASKNVFEGVVSLPAAAVARAWVQRVRMLQDDGALQRIVEVLLERESVEESWGFAWKIAPKARGQLVIAGVSAKSPAGRWNQRADMQNGICLRRGCTVLSINGSTNFEELKLHLVDGLRLSTRFITASTSKPLQNSNLAMFGDSPVAKRKVGVVSKTASVPWRVKNSFLEVISSDFAFDDSELDPVTQSEPPPSRHSDCEGNRTVVQNCRVKKTSVQRNPFADECVKATRSPKSRSSHCHLGFGDAASGCEAAPNMLPGTCPPAAAAVGSGITETPVEALPDTTKPNVDRKPKRPQPCALDADIFPNGSDREHSDGKKNVEFSLAGQRALICGLSLHAGFNDQWCDIQRYDSTLRRYEVQINTSSGEPVTAKLKRENLMITPITPYADNTDDDNIPVVSRHFEPREEQPCQAMWYENWAQPGYCRQFEDAAWPGPFPGNLPQQSDWTSCESMRLPTVSRNLACIAEAPTISLDTSMTRPTSETHSLATAPFALGHGRSYVTSVGVPSVGSGEISHPVPVSTAPVVSMMGGSMLACQRTSEAAAGTVPAGGMTFGVVTRVNTGTTLSSRSSVNSCIVPRDPFMHCPILFPPPVSPPKSPPSPPALLATRTAALLSLDELVHPPTGPVGSNGAEPTANQFLRQNSISHKSQPAGPSEVVSATAGDGNYKPTIEGDRGVWRIGQESVVDRVRSRTSLEFCALDFQPVSAPVADRSRQDPVAEPFEDECTQRSSKTVVEGSRVPKPAVTESKPSNGQSAEGSDHCAELLNDVVKDEDDKDTQDPYSGWEYFSLDGSLGWSPDFEEGGLQGMARDTVRESKKEEAIKVAALEPGHDLDTRKNVDTGRGDPNTCMDTAKDISAENRKFRESSQDSASEWMRKRLQCSQTNQNHPVRSAREKCTESQEKGDWAEHWSVQVGKADSRSSEAGGSSPWHSEWWHSEWPSSTGSTARASGRPKKPSSRASTWDVDSDVATSAAWYAESVSSSKAEEFKASNSRRSTNYGSERAWNSELSTWQSSPDNASSNAESGKAGKIATPSRWYADSLAKDSEPTSKKRRSLDSNAKPNRVNESGWHSGKAGRRARNSDVKPKHATERTNWEADFWDPSNGSVVQVSRNDFNVVSDVKSNVSSVSRATRRRFRDGNPDLIPKYDVSKKGWEARLETNSWASSKAVTTQISGREFDAVSDMKSTVSNISQPAKRRSRESYLTYCKDWAEKESSLYAGSLSSLQTSSKTQRNIASSGSWRPCLRG